ncbi:MAG: hypothetical protein QF793_01645 [Candidatus Peribacteraceae bacterium]|jgi:hypothetical protein|nr:hypothetical protein [bacterium]MDP6561606.1 hypothetical protein [Candidatus Peribacteraceae bacterium]
MKKLFALIGSFALLSACTFTVSTDLDQGDQEDDTVPAEETVEEGSSEEPEVPVEEDDGTVDGETNEDAGGDGTNTTGGDAASSEEAASEAEASSEAVAE